MAKNVNHVSHIKSKQIVDGKPKLPEASSLIEGEIAINFAEGVETISTKNESGNVVTFSSDDYYTSKKLGSGFTGENSGRTVTEAIEEATVTVDQVIDSGTSASTNAVSTKAVYDKIAEDEETWAIALNELNNNKFGYAEFDNDSKSIGFYKDFDEASSGDPISTVDLSSFSIDIDQVIDSGTSASTDAVSTSAVYGFVTSYTPSITVDQVLDNTTSASTNPVSSKAVYKAVTDNELVWTNAFVELSGVTSAHTENTDIHVTANDKTAWNAKLDASAIVNFFDDAKYEDSGTTKVINFYHGSTVKATIDASDFIVDGMVDDVRIENGNLVIDFNTESGKQDISIPLTDIFDPSNYYNKTAIDSLVGSGFTSSSITEVIIENEEITSAALTDLDERKLDATAYTPTDLSNYYTKSETSGKTEIQNALDAKANTATTLAGYGITDAYTKSDLTGSSTTVVVAKANSANTASTVALTGVTDADDLKAIEALTGTSGLLKKTAANTWSLDTTAYSSATEVQTALNSKANTATTLAGYGITDAYTKSETSGKTEIENALNAKVNTADIVTAITPSNSGSTNPIATSVVAENELTVSDALTDLDERKLDASAYTPTDLSNYYTKSETSGKTEIQNALDAKQHVLTEGRGIDISNNVISIDLPISAGTGTNSIIEGSGTTASGNYSHAEGYNTVASGDSSHAEGEKTSAGGYAAHAEGWSTTASGRCSHAEGYQTSAMTDYSHAEGNNTKANGDYSHAEGYNTVASGDSSHAEGEGAQATNSHSHAEGYSTSATAYASHAEGDGSSAEGYASHAEGESSASGEASHAEGGGTTAEGDYSHSEGNDTTASGRCSHAEGNTTHASNSNSHAEGYNTVASGDSSHAEGDSTVASGDYSHAEGENTEASGEASHAEGNSTSASGYASHAEGGDTTASNDYSHAEGYGTTSSGDSSHAEGAGTTASGNQSHAEGYHTQANNQAEHASGHYNVSSSASTTFGDSGNTLFSVGNGRADNARHNAFEIRQNGDIYIVSGGTNTSPMIKLQDNIGTINTSIEDLSGQSETIAAALVDLNANKADKSTTLSGYGITDAYTKTEIDNMIGNIETLLAAI